ncbi:MAG: hypothetical protein NC402_00995 [Prevotella sp.]|nr:hypothetical protein [Prevotella sp.]
MLIFTAKERKGEGRWAQPGYASGVRIRLFVSYLAVFAILACIYFFMPYQHETGLPPYQSRDILSFRNFLSAIMIELIVVQFVVMILRHQGEKNPQSKYADPDYMKRLTRKAHNLLYIITGLTILLWLLLKFVF